MDRFSSKGFTLIELLVVIGILGLLASIILVSLSGTKDNARIASGQQFAASIYHASGANAVGMWEMEEGSGATVTDMSPKNNTGTISGATWSTEVPYGQKRASLLFNGSSYVVSTYNSSFALGQAGFTWVAWIRPTSMPVDHGMIISQGPTTYFSIRNAGNLYFSVGTSGGQQTTNSATGVISTNKWYLVAATYDSSGNLKIYLDGKQVASAGPYAAPTSPLSDVRIGVYSNPALYGFTGYMTQVRYYNNAIIGAEEMEKLYAEESGYYGL